MLLLIALHASAYRKFKRFYTQRVCHYWRQAFPGWVSYNRLVRMEFIGLDSIVRLLCGYLRHCFGRCTGVSFIEHARHRSPVNCWVNLGRGLIADYHQPKQPSLVIDTALPAFA